MIRKRDLLVGAVAWPAVAYAQTRVGKDRRLVGLLWPYRDAASAAQIAKFSDELRERGWSNDLLAIEQRQWDGRDGNLHILASELFATKPDVIVAVTSAVLRAVLAVHKDENASIVFINVGDPVAQGFVDTIARPGRKITGFSAFEPEIGGKWLQLLKEAFPSMARVCVMYSPTTTATLRSFIAVISAIAMHEGISVTEIAYDTPNELADTLGRLSSGEPTGIVALPSPRLATFAEEVVDRVSFYKLPAIYGTRLVCLKGGLLSYVNDLSADYRRAVDYVDRILRGELAENLPVHRPTKYILTVNLQAAKKIDLSVPASLISQADEIID